jgi:hypothetical protein
MANLVENPFYVLGLPATCSRAEVERQGQKLLGMVELGLSAARSYTTPLGPRPLDATRVREAMAALRDPERRLLHELTLAAAPAAPGLPATAANGAPKAAPLAEARRRLGWGGSAR